MHIRFILSITLLLSALSHPSTTYAATIQSQVTAATAGSVLSIPSGTYNEQITISKPLVLECLGECKTLGFIIKANNATVRGFDITSPRTVNNSFGIHVYNNDCVIENNRIHNTVRDGIVTETTSSGCRITNNTLIRTSQTGMEIRGSSHTIEGNNVSKTIQYPTELKSDSYWGNTSNRVTDADCFRFFGSGHRFKNNYCHDITYGPQYNDQGLMIGENIDPHVDGFQTWNESKHPVGNNILFDNNTIILSGSGGGYTNKSVQLAGGASNLTFTNNIFVTNLGALVVQTVNGIVFDHNTWVGDKSNNGSWGVDARLCNNCKFTNSIFAYHINGFGYLNTNSTAVINNNCVWQSGGNRPPDPGEIRQDPLFINESTNDFSLKPESPCAGKGALTQPTNPSPSPTPKPGDLDGDGHINYVDFNLLITNFGNPYTIFDFNDLVSNYGK